MPGHVARVVLACPPQPFAEIGTDRGYAILPYAIDRRGEIVPVTGGHPRDHGVGVLVPKTSKKLELNVVDQRTTLQGIELVDCLRNLARGEAMDRLEEK